MAGTWTGAPLRPGGAQTGTWSAMRTVANDTVRNGVERWIVTRIPAAERLAAGSQPQSFHADLLWRGDSLISFPLGTAPLVGTVRAGHIAALWPDTDTRMLVLKGTRASGDSMAGTWATFAPPARTGTWVAVREGQRRSPRTVTYEPKRWYTNYSASNVAELQAVPGDTIRLRGQSSGSGIVPAPIAVDGALPGDLLAVRILRIRPTPSTAWSERSFPSRARSAISRSRLSALRTSSSSVPCSSSWPSGIFASPRWSEGSVAAFLQIVNRNAARPVTVAR